MVRGLPAPWRRAPLLLFAQPLVFAAVAGAAAILAIAAASGPLFLGSVRTAALHQRVAQTCPQRSMPDVLSPGTLTRGGQVAAADGQVRSVLRRAGMPAPELVVTGSGFTTSGGPSGVDTVTLFTRPGVLRHVRVVASAPASRGGVWLPEQFARTARLRPGGSFTLGRRSVPIAGVYRDLPGSQLVAGVEVPRYWCTWQPLISPTPEHAPPPLVLADRATVLAAGDSLTAGWYAPIHAESLSAPRAAELADRAAHLAATVTGDRFPPYRSTSTLSSLVDDAQRTRDGVRDPLLAVAAAGVFAGAVLLAAAGGFWTVRRSAELRLLVGRGVGPAAIAGKAALEMAPAALVGGAVGWAGALGLVRAFGPSPLLDPGAAVRTVALVAAAAVGGLLVAAAVAGTAGREATPARRSRGGPLWLAAGLLVLAAAVGSERWIAAHGGATVGRHNVVRVNAMVLVFPLLGLAGCLPLIGLLAVRAVRRTRGLAGRLPVAGYLAVRGMAARAAAAAALAGVVALPIGILVYSAAMTGVIRSGVTQKSHTYVGADHAFGVLVPPGAAVDTANAGTTVTLVEDGATVGDTSLAILGVEPTSFARHAYRGSALRGTLAKLGTGRVVPAIAVNGVPGTPRRVQVRNSTLPIRVVARMDTFPGLRDSNEPMLVVARAALRPTDPYVTREDEVWTDDAHRSATTAALLRHHVQVRYRIVPRGFVDASSLRPVVWGFGYLAALGVLVGLLSISALVTATAARVRRRAVAYHLFRRMGMSPGSHRRAIAAEVGAVVALGVLSGIGLALGVVALVYRTLDVNPSFRPAAPFVVPGIVLWVSAGVAVVAVVGTAVQAHRRASATNPAETMRVG